LISYGRPDDSEPSRGRGKRAEGTLDTDGDQHALRVDSGKLGRGPRVTKNLAGRRGGLAALRTAAEGKRSTGPC
jgi:hypothetical protein